MTEQTWFEETLADRLRVRVWKDVDKARDKIHRTHELECLREILTEMPEHDRMVIDGVAEQLRTECELKDIEILEVIDVIGRYLNDKRIF
jgi:hypothetical protein